MDLGDHQLININSTFEFKKTIEKKQGGWNVPTAYFYQDPIIRDYYHRLMRLFR